MSVNLRDPNTGDLIPVAGNGDPSSLLASLNNIPNYIVWDSSWLEKLFYAENNTKSYSFTNWVDDTNFPRVFGSGIINACLDYSHRTAIYVCTDGSAYIGHFLNSNGTITASWNKVSFDGRKGMHYDLLPYLNTSVFSCSTATADYISDKTVLINISNLTANTTGINTETFSNLPFHFTYASFAFLFQDPYLGADEPNKCVVMPGGNSLFTQHTANKVYTGQIVLPVGY